MRISGKIALLVAFFLGVLAVDGYVGSRLIARMNTELHGVVNNDVVLMQTATQITRYQLQKAIVFERARRIAEELAYQSVTPARKEHLLFHTKLAKTNFEELSKEGALNIVDGKLLVDTGIRQARDPKAAIRLQRVAAVFKEIEKAHIHYDAVIGEMFNAVLAGKYELSPDDLGQIHRDEKKLTTELQNLVGEVQTFTKGTLANARAYEATAEIILWFTLIASLLASFILALWIMHSISEPLKALVGAAQQIGDGRLEVSLAENSRDEFGELSRAFNQMSRQLVEAKRTLEEQSATLKRNLDLTEQQKKDLEKVNRELDRFVQTVSHDIRSPLMGIVWYADYLKNNYYDTLDKKGQDSLDGACRSVERANALIQDLLTLTRISRVRNPYQHVQIGALVEEVTANLEYKIKQNRVDLRVQPNLPTVICDGIKIKEVFLNLLTNAIKFSSKQEVQPKIDIRYVENTDTHEFIVRDNGIGIDPAHHEEIFAIFKRLDVSEKYEGTGAGLSIVKSVIDDHGGKVWVVSGLGMGSEFHFTIPKGLESHKQA
ncbi:MAG: HAMP domain-containing protein [Candidatus Omnitrophica bacterium]|nr:HAMP domain-containing protein [Candidatus Omnitrophota bacterium]